jgi:prolyl-tRNA synthetase
MVAAENGEDAIVQCSNCGYAANLERAEIGARSHPSGAGGGKPLQKVDTPNVGSIEQVSKLLGCQPSQMLKTLIYLADGQPLAALIRGDHDVNENKLRRAVGANRIELAPPDVIEKVTGAPVGFAGPIGLSDCALWADHDVSGVVDAIIGANEADKHYTGANLRRDFEVPPQNFADLRNAGDGDPCPRCSTTMALRHAIEVGHVFKLGTKYSDALGAKFLDNSEQQHSIIMGCYGIGVNRILAALIETKHDDDGIVWPISLAPYEVVLAPLNVAQDDVMQVANELHDKLDRAGVDVLLDDRDCRAGVKFKDADLIGIPLRVVIGGRSLKEGKLEIKWRDRAEPEFIALDNAATTLTDLVSEAKSAATHRGS